MLEIGCHRYYGTYDRERPLNKSVFCQLRSAIDRIELEMIILPGLGDS